MRTRFVPLMVFSLVALLAVAGTVTAQSEDPNPDAPQWVDAQYDLALDETLEAIDLEGEVGFHKIETSNSQLQRQCGGSTCSADDIRDAYQFAGDSGKQRIVESIETRLESRIQGSLASLGATNITTDADADESSLAQSTEDGEYQPPIPVAASGSGDLAAFDEAGVTTEQVEALFQMGATVDQQIEIPVEPGTNLTVTLSVPAPLHILGAENGETAADGTHIVWVDENWQNGETSTIEDVVTIGDPNVDVPTETDAEVEVTLDISNVNVRYGGLMGDSAPADARVAIDVDGRFAAIENPRDLERVDLDYLSADALRIALAHDLLETRQLISVEERAREQMKQTFEGLTDEEVEVTGGFAAEDLSAQAIGDPAGTGEAIELPLNASAQVAFPPEQPSGATTQAFTVTTLSMGTLELPNLDTDYDLDKKITVVLPEGLALDFEAPDGYTVEESTRDGRQAYTFASAEDGSEGSQAAAIQDADIVVNHPFVWDVFWPVLVALALLLVVLPAVVIGLTIRRRRKHGPPRTGEAAQPVSGSQATQRTDASEE